MTDRELELRLKKAVESCTPDVLDKIMTDCGSYKEKEKKGQYKKNKVIDISGKAGEKKNINEKKTGRNRIGAIAAMLVVLIGVGIFGSVQYNIKHVVSVVQLDVNPSMEIRINKKEEVVEAYGLNTDGKEILSGMKLKGLDVYTATNAIVGSLLKHGYIDELANSILLSVEDDDSARGIKLQESLSGEINAILQGASVHASILSQHVDGKSVETVSQQYGISHGKAALIEHILESNTNYSFEELSKLSVNELNLIVSNPKNQVQDIQTSGEAAKNAYIGEKKANQIAFSHAGIAENSVYEVEVEIDYEYGTMVYDVEFASGEKEYEYYINAVNGEIIKYEVEDQD